MHKLFFYLCGKFTTYLPPSVGVFHFNFVSMKTRDHKPWALCGTAGAMTVRRSELWTVSKCFEPERRNWCSFRRITHFCESNSNSNLGPHLRWWISNLETSEYFGTYSPNTPQALFIKPGLTNVSEWQCDKFTVPHTTICRRGNRLTPWIKGIWFSYLFKATEYFRCGNLY